MSGAIPLVALNISAASVWRMWLCIETDCLSLEVLEMLTVYYCILYEGIFHEVRLF